ncbi:MAG: phosphatase PAP2 family protein [Candidatus Lokiarchaeota archaeon]|nr:phosphatase PAP2 family protein [Candidatus Lokiarchaeota archaeon]
MKSSFEHRKTIMKRIRALLLIFLYSALALLTIMFMINDGWLDKLITNQFYDSTLPLGERFFLEDDNPWKWMNDNEIVFDVTMVIFFAVLLIIGLIRVKHPKGKLLTRYSLYIIISVVISVGLIVNVIFKGLYGRPRPVQTDLWPNSLSADMYDFFFVWEPAFLKNPALIGEGKSFPSGHTSATAMFSLIFFVFRNNDIWKQMVPNNPKLNTSIYIITRIFKWLGFVIGTIGSVIMGLSRVVAGKHFASDVLWAIAFVWTVSWVFYEYVFRIPKKESMILNLNF